MPRPRNPHMCTALWPFRPGQKERQQCTRNKTGGSAYCILHTHEAEETKRLEPIHDGMQLAHQEAKRKQVFKQGYTDGLVESSRILSCPVCRQHIPYDRTSYLAAERKIDQFFVQYSQTLDKKPDAITAGRFYGAYAYTVERNQQPCTHPPAPDSDADAHESLDEEL